MQVYLAVVAAAAFYAVNVPIYLVFRLDAGGENKLKVGVGLFAGPPLWQTEIQLTNEALVSALKRPRKHTNLQWKAAAGHLLRHMSAEEASFSLRLGFSDAAKTALVCGAAQAAVQALRQSKLPNLRTSVCPVFEKSEFRLKVGGILSIRLGHIISAVTLMGKDAIVRRITDGTASN